MLTELRLRSLLTYFSNVEFSDAQVASINKQLRSALLDFGSETPDNLASVDRIEVGKVQEDGVIYSGLKIKGKDIRLSTLMYSIENMELPAVLQEEFPDLTQEDWNGVTRIMSLIFLCLEDSKWEKKKKSAT